MAKKKDKRSKKAAKPKSAKLSKPARKAAAKTVKPTVKAKARPAPKSVAKPKLAPAKAPPSKPVPVRVLPGKPLPPGPAGSREPANERFGSSRIPTPVGPTNATVFPLAGALGDDGPSEFTIPKETRKKMFHIDDETLAKIVNRLDEMRRESQAVVHQHVTNDLEQQKEVTDVGDDLDQAVTERYREFDLIMHQRHLRRLNQVQDAFARMQDGTYGFCEGTDEPINPKRLIIMPLARFSLEYQEQQEKMLGRSPEDALGSEESFAADE